MPKRKIKILFALLFASLAVVLTFQIYRYWTKPKIHQTQQKVLQVARVEDKHNLGMPHIGGPFTLVDPYNKIITEKSFPGKYLLIYFGYSFCPDICPAALLNISDALKALGHLTQKLQVIFITLDPERDTKEALKTYIKNFDNRILPLTGTQEQIQAAAKAYRVFYRKMHPENATEYVVDHSSIIYMMNPQGKLVRHFNHQTPVQELVYEIRQALK